MTPRDLKALASRQAERARRARRSAGTLFAVLVGMIAFLAGLGWLEITSPVPCTALTIVAPVLWVVRVACLVLNRGQDESDRYLQMRQQALEDAE